MQKEKLNIAARLLLSTDEPVGDLDKNSEWIREVDLAELFLSLTRRLCERFEINRGVLVLRRRDSHRLAAYSTWNNGHTREGLTINLPEDPSLFEKVAESGQVYTENFCDTFTGNFFERKLLLDSDSRSFVLQPLKSEGQVVGLIGYSSEQPTAFTMFEEGLLEKMANRFGAIVERKLYHD